MNSACILTPQVTLILNQLGTPHTELHKYIVVSFNLQVTT